MITFADFGMPFQVGFLLLLLHGLLQLVPVITGLVRLLLDGFFLLARVRLTLSLDDSRPLIDAASSILRVVSLVVVGEGVEFVAFVFKWLFDSLRVDLQRIDQVARHSFILQINIINSRMRPCIIL